MLSDEFYQEIVEHPIPTDMNAVRLLSSAPATPPRSTATPNRNTKP